MALKAHKKPAIKGHSGTLRLMRRVIGLLFVAALAVSGCGGADLEADASDTVASSNSPSKSSSTKLAKPTLDARKIAKTFKVTNGGRPIAKMCDPQYTHWACFYDGIETRTDSSIRLNLSTDGGWSDAELNSLANNAALHWFNFVGTDHPDLDSIVVYVNGIDRGTTYRRDVPLLNR